MAAYLCFWTTFLWLSFINALGDTSTYPPDQATNIYVFPGIGPGAILSKAVRIADNMIHASGKALSRALHTEEITRNLICPDISRIQEVSVIVDRDVMRIAQEDKVDREIAGCDMSNIEHEAWIKARMYDPRSGIASLDRYYKFYRNLDPVHVLEINTTQAFLLFFFQDLTSAIRV
jgi:malate dehydrogenase (oxaloacetate-decarboxylating)(NADP+)